MENNYLRNARIRAGLTLREMGRRLGVSRSAVMYWEKGSCPRPGRMQQIADVLGIDIDDLIASVG